MKGKRNLREGKRVVQSRDQANMNLDLDQLCSSSQDLYHHMIALPQQHHVVVRVA